LPLLEKIREIAREYENKSGLVCEFEHEGLKDIEGPNEDIVARSITETMYSSEFSEGAGKLKIKIYAVRGRAMLVFKWYDSKIEGVFSQTARWLYLDACK